MYQNLKIINLNLVNFVIKIKKFIVIFTDFLTLIFIFICYLIITSQLKYFFNSNE